MKFIINKSIKENIKSFKTFDLGFVEEDIDQLLNNSMIVLDKNTLPILIIDGVNYLINNFNPNNYKEDFEILLTNSDLVSLGEGSFTTLQTVTDAGNITDNSVVINNTLTTFGRIIYNDSSGLDRIEINNTAGGYVRLRASGRIELKENFLAAIKPSLLTANRTLDLPNETGTLTTENYVNERGSVLNTTTAVLSASDLNTAYPNAKDGFSVICPNVIGGGKYYIKAGAGWVYQQILAVV